MTQSLICHIEASSINQPAFFNQLKKNIKNLSSHRIKTIIIISPINTTVPLAIHTAKLVAAKFQEEYANSFSMTAYHLGLFTLKKETLNIDKSSLEKIFLYSTSPVISPILIKNHEEIIYSSIKIASKLHDNMPFSKLFFLYDRFIDSSKPYPSSTPTIIHGTLKVFEAEIKSLL